MSQQPEPAVAATTDHASRIAEAAAVQDKIALVADWLLTRFNDYYVESRNIPWLAKAAFERRDHQTSLWLSKRRLSMYSESIESLGPALRRAFPAVTEREDVWDAIEACYLPRIEGRYESDLAFAFLHSARRIVYQGEWKPVDYSFLRDDPEPRRDLEQGIARRFPVGRELAAADFAAVLAVPAFSAPWRDLDDDCNLLAARLRQVADGYAGQGTRLTAIEMLEAGFYRNRGAYLVGAGLLADGRRFPLIVALLNDADGIYVDALLTNEADAHNIFSSTLANFHVTNAYYHELAAFLNGIMPQRPLGLQYSTIGFNHVGKVAVMNELKDELARSGERLATSAGFRGTVAIGFAATSSAYNLKVIRDRPTAGYKWGEFPGVAAVLAKYARVHEINRTGSMLDNIIYYNVKLDRDWFDPVLLGELVEQASLSVHVSGTAVIFKHLIVQRRQTPLPLFLASASEHDRRTAVINLGHCIKNNAAANIFNKDLDARNYGVSKFLKVHLFDYDALEPFTDVKIRTNADRCDGEEDVPDWFFEDGIVFLPEEIEAGLCVDDRELRRLFRAVHGDLLTTAYWERIQRELREGRVPGIRIYPEHCDLRPEDAGR
ncbi:MAG: isocitrate dehydrogenase kinase/phosphatase AceK regulatory subunit [Gammaproteobacteria bacterium]|nr:isocitrate dehydrogenase kinase/phosphatase AceK regulatory subunit [Gammaproteobacteria bacterium]